MEEKKQSEIIFLDGFSFKRPREGAPDFVKGAMSFKVDTFIEFLKKHENNGWVNADLQLSKKGTLYAKLNTWTKETGDVPFGENKAKNALDSAQQNSYDANEEYNKM